MNPTQRIVIVLISFVFLSSLGTPLAAADDWLPVPPEDLALKDNPASPGTNAMILYREVNIEAKQASMNHYVRIKIFTKEGTKEADQEIPFNKVQESIEGVRGRTIRPDGSVTEFNGKTFDRVIEKNGRAKYLAKTFTLPDVEPGSIIEYKYRDQFDDRYYWSVEWAVQSHLFARLQRFSIKQSDSFYAPLLSFRMYGLPADVSPKPGPQGLYTPEVHDMPGIEEEPYMLPPSALLARVDFYYRDMNDPTGETPGQFWKRMNKKWNENLEHFAVKGSGIASELNRILNPSDSPEETLRKIYTRVQQIRNLNAEEQKTKIEAKAEELKPNTNAEDELKHGYGNARDINFLFVAMARAAGFDATEVYLAPRNRNIFIPNIRVAEQLSADVVCVHAGGRDYYLDPGARYYPFGLLPWYESSTQGMRLNKQGGEFIDSPAAASADATLVRHTDLIIGDDDSATAKIQVDFTGQEAALRRQDNRDEDEAGRKKVLEEEIKRWLPAEATVELTNVANWDNTAQPIHVEGTVTIPGPGGAGARRLLVPMELFQATQPASFASQKRVNDIYFPYPFEEIDNVTFHPPAGYKPAGMPPAQKVAPGPVSYEISALLQGDAVEVQRRLILNGIAFSQKAYPGLRSFFNIVRTDDNTQILLQRTEAAKN